MSAEEQTAASTAAAPAVEPSTNGDQANGAAEPTTTNGDAQAMEVDGGEAAPAADEKKEEETTDGAAETKTDEKPAAEQPEKSDEAESEPAKKESSKPASGRQTRPKPESAAKPASTTEKKAARPKSAVGGGPAKSKASGAAASAAAADRTYSYGDIVLGRLKGYPPWPARVTNPDDLPHKVIAQRPSKNPSIYCVQYFPAGDYSWLNTREITPLSPSDINDWLNAGHRATGLLRKAYETAKDPSEWDESQAAKLQAAADAEDEDEEMDVDELEDEEGEETGGKRKKAGANKKGPAKKAKTDKKAKPESEAPKSKPKAAAKKAEKPESKPAAAAEPTGDEDPAASDPICVKVKGWRHSLQRAFLGKDLPSAEEMPAHDETFKKIEAYNDMTIQALQYSKIGKVMKKISTLEGIPRDDELHIRERAAKLMNDWHAFIEKEQGAEGQANGDKE